MTWVYDENRNRASVEHWGSEDAARKSLETLADCSRCSDCFGCFGCYACSRCFGCSGCSEVASAAIPEVPVISGIHRKVYAAASDTGALDMSYWHTCETTHCRAGWVVNLAGAAGSALEAFFNTELAAMKIYEASGYKINPCRFYDTNDVALEHMLELAEKEAV